jgi:4-amino-4-deoxy-L-arabinose transferase-like glycosyltransferase
MAESPAGSNRSILLQEVLSTMKGLAGVPWPVIALVALIGTYVAIVAISSPQLASPIDEPTHIRDGLTHLTRGRFVDAERAPWTVPSPYSLLTVFPGALAAVAGQSPDYRADAFTPFEHVRIARIANHVIGALLLVWVFVWARKLWGPAGGLLSAALLLFHPLFLAHCTVVSTDLYGALGTFATAYILWYAFLSDPRAVAGPGSKWWKAGLSTGVVLGLAILCKVSALVLLGLLPVVGAWVGWRCRKRHPAVRYVPFARSLGAAMFAALIALFLSAAGYDLLSPSPIADTSRGVPFDLPVGRSLVSAAKSATTAWHLSRHALTFFDGDLVRPAPYHYAVGLALKTPIGLLVLGAFVLGTLFSPGTSSGGRRRARWYLVALIVLLGSVFVTRGFYLGIRHLLPLFPLCAVLAGGLIPRFERFRCRARAWRWALLGTITFLAVSAAVETIRATPWQMSYFNCLGRGKLILADSDGDWGQGLRALGRWQRRYSPDRPIWLAYFGANRPEDFGVSYRGLLSPLGAIKVERPAPFGRDPDELDGFVAIGQTQLAGTWMQTVGKSGDYYARWRELTPAFVVGGTINIYDLHRSAGGAPLGR